MKIYDISQEVFSCGVYPGDPRPEKQTVYSTEKGKQRKAQDRSDSNETQVFILHTKTP